MKVGRLVRVFFQLCVGDWYAQLISETFEIFQSHLFHLVGRVAPFERLSQGESLNSLCQNHCWLTLVFNRRLVGCVNLAVIVPASLETPNLVIGHVFDHLKCAWITPEEVFANKRTVFGFVCLVITIWGFIH